MQSVIFALLSLKARLEDHKQREQGATAVEYGLMVVLIAVAIIAMVTLLGDTLVDVFGQIVDALGGDSSSA